MEIPDLEPEFAPYSETIEDVTLACKALTKDECKRFFDRDIIGKGFQPVQMAIVNNSDRYMLFSTDGVSLTVCPSEEVAKACHTSTAGRAAGYTVAGLVMWPFLIPAVVDGVKSSKANTKLDKDFNEKNIEQMVIDPHSNHNGVIFFKKENYQTSFVVKLIDKESRQKFEYAVTGLEPAK